MTYFKTEAGQLAFKQRSEILSVRQRRAFILIDGIKPLSKILAETAGMGIARVDLDHMLSHGLISEGTGPESEPVVEIPSSLQPPPVSQRTPQERFNQARPLAMQVTDEMGLRGFGLNVEAEAARDCEELMVLLPKIQKLAGVKRCVKLAHALLESEHM